MVEVEATPLQAAIAELFETVSMWTAIDIGEKLGVQDQAFIRSGLSFWADLGVLREEIGGWFLVEGA